jgi:hypothetical protein
MSASEQAIIEMLKRNHLEGLPRQGNRHAFWDTQVSSRRGLSCRKTWT